MEETLGEGTEDVEHGKEGKVIRSWTDYLLGIDCSIFRNVVI